VIVHWVSYAASYSVLSTAAELWLMEREKGETHNKTDIHPSVSLDWWKAVGGTGWG